MCVWSRDIHAALARTMPKSVEEGVTSLQSLGASKRQQCGFAFAVSVSAEMSGLNPALRVRLKRSALHKVPDVGK